ncbi:hypothetical protein ACIBUY_38565 [Streptomyces sp. NPDC050085]|uniref:hypothetical protein n=1 Tax=Streptomyces sp. NPDC050085 TaxID=3365600 RepID=UPI0037B75CBA
MESRLQQRLRERREKAALESARAHLGDLLTGRTLGPAEVPTWTGEAISTTWDIFTEPAETLPDDASPAELSAWLEGLLEQQGLTGTAAGRVYVATHLSDPPWLECLVGAAGWTERVRGAVEDPWMFLATTLDKAVVIAEAEYCYEAHVLAEG